MWLSGLGRVSLKRGSEVPGQEFLDAADGVVGDLGQDGAEVEFRVKSIQFGRSCRAPDYAEAEHTALSWY